MEPASYAIFKTALGECAILWRDGKATGVLLPEQTHDAMLRSVRRRDNDAKEDAPPPTVQALIDGVQRLARGEETEFDLSALDRSAIEPFANRVYDELLLVPFGETTTYGAIAETLGDKNLSRAVGAALGANPFPVIIPCHRVTAANGAMGGFSAPGGAATKRKLLEIEGVFSADKLPLFSA
ncbi:MAG: methylated-DNA--[protein]-cysteine S-methyltransferase [Parvularculaceae bacterium]